MTALSAELNRLRSRPLAMADGRQHRCNDRDGQWEIRCNRDRSRLSGGRSCCNQDFKLGITELCKLCKKMKYRQDRSVPHSAGDQLDAIQPCSRQADATCALSATTPYREVPPAAASCRRGWGRCSPLLGSSTTAVTWCASPAKAAERHAGARRLPRPALGQLQRQAPAAGRQADQRQCCRLARTARGRCPAR